MSARPPDIRIADLTAPVLTESQRGALAYAEQNPVVFSEPVLLEAARRQTRLSDFGADGFRARLRVQLQAIEADRDLNALGRLGVWSNLLRYLCNRLRLEDLIRRHPEILEVRLPRPIIVVGLPRTGTTHLLNLLAADTRQRSLPYWESLEPVPVRGEGPGRDGRHSHSSR